MHPADFQTRRERPSKNLRDTRQGVTEELPTIVVIAIFESQHGAIHCCLGRHGPGSRANYPAELIGRFQQRQM